VTSPLLVSSGQESSLTYEPYYGLSEKPFSLSADPKFLYKSPSHAAAFDDLLLGIRRREGIILLTGDIGTGKTTLCRAVLEQLDRTTISTFVADPYGSREDLLKILLVDFGVMSVDDLKSGRLSEASGPDLSYPLYEFLKSLLPLQAPPVLIIDEAQNLSLPMREEIRTLSDLEAPAKVLQVVLVGQLEFRSKLKLPEMRQVDQRISARCSLETLTCDGVAGYVTHRLTVAGGGPDRIQFTPDAISAIHAATGGVPRVINLVCDRALYRGHLDHKSVIDAETVALAMDDLGLSTATTLKPASARRSKIVEFDAKTLHEAFPLGLHEPMEAAPPAPAQRPSFPSGAEPDTPIQQPRRIHSGFGESEATRRWRERARRLVEGAGQTAETLLRVLRRKR
jgi:general secretion pathway protein A